MVVGGNGGGENNGDTNLSSAYVTTTRRGLGEEVIAKTFQEAMGQPKKPEATVIPQQKIIDETTIKANPFGTTGIEATPTPKDLSAIEGVLSWKPAAVEEITTPVTPPTIELKPEIINEAPPAAIKPEINQTKEVEPDSIESMLEKEKLQKQQEAQDAWKELINSIDDGKNENPYFVSLTTNEQKTLVLIKPTDGKFIQITPDGLKATQATKEIQSMINKHILNSKDNKLENLDGTLIPTEDGLNLINKAIEESQKTAVEIGRRREEIKRLETNKTFPQKIMELVKSRQAATFSSTA